MATLVEEIEVVDSALQELAREPLAPRTGGVITGLIERLDALLRSPELAKVQRASTARGLQHVADNLRIMQDVVGAQVERLGGEAPWVLAFAEAVARMREQIAAIKQAAKDEIDVINKGLAAALRDNAIEQYIVVAVQAARLSKLEEDEGWFAEIDGFPGVWADGASPEASLATLAEVLRDWLKIKLAYQDPDIPVVANIDLSALARGA